jgi:hypothetical protein
MKQARWDAIREYDKRKATSEERRLELEEEKIVIEIMADENR